MPAPNPFGGPSQEQTETSSNTLDAIREQTSKIEDLLDTVAEPIKPYVSVQRRLFRRAS